HTATFSEAYTEQIANERRDGPWFRELASLIEDPNTYLLLNATKLVEHAFGIAKTFKGRDALLVYLYWEPENANEVEECGLHRLEIGRLSNRITGSFPEFTAVSYQDLWKQWESRSQPSWLAEHVQALRDRYGVSI